MSADVLLDPTALRDALPSGMLAAKRWLLHDARKIPHYIDGTRRHGELDDADDSARLATLDEALSALNGRERFAGIGFALGNGWQGIDLDKHRDPESGELSTLARHIVDECGSYTEISPSGAGIHIIGHGAPFAPIGAAKTEHRIEAYSAARYFTVTGRTLRNPGEACDLAPVVERLRKSFANDFAHSQERTGDANGWADVGEGQRNDFLSREAGKMRRIGLSLEPLAAALHTINEQRCMPPLSRDEVDAIARSVGRYAPGQDAPERQRAEWPPIIDLRELAQREPQAPSHIVDQWLPAGEVTLLPGHGGGGKSLVALYFAACVALGRPPWHGLATQRRHVTYVSAEDNAGILHWRMGRICAHLGVSLADLAGALDLLDLSHVDAELMVDVPHADAMLTASYDELRTRIDPAGLLVLDGASDLYGSSEILRRHVRRYIRALRRLIGPEGAVILLAHVDKAAARDGTASDRYSGSTAWHNSVRARWSLTTDPDGALVLTLAKANYSQAGAEVRLHWNPDAHLYLPDTAPAGGVVGAIRERNERRDILRAFASCDAAGMYVPAASIGRRTSWHVLSQRPEFPDSLKRDDRTTRGRFLRHIESLRHTVLIAEGTIRRSNRHETITFVLTPEGRAECAE